MNREVLMCMISTAARCDEDARGGGALPECSKAKADILTNGCSGTSTDKETGTAVANHPPRRCSATVAVSPIATNSTVVVEERYRDRAGFPAVSGASPSPLNLKQRIQVIVRIRPIEDAAPRCGLR